MCLAPEEKLIGLTSKLGQSVMNSIAVNATEVLTSIGADGKGSQVVVKKQSAQDVQQTFGPSTAAVLAFYGRSCSNISLGFRLSRHLFFMPAAGTVSMRIASLCRHQLWLELDGCKAVLLVPRLHKKAILECNSLNPKP